MARIIEIPHDDIIGKTLMLFTQTCRLMSKYMDAYFYKKSPLSFTKFLALKVLAGANGVMTHTQMAEWTQTELHTVVTLVARMKKDGLVSTERSDIDKRIVNIVITDKGRKALEEAMPVGREMIDRIMSSISERDAVRLGRMLEVLRDNAYDGLESLARDA